MSSVIEQSQLPEDLPPPNDPEEDIEETDDPEAPYGRNEDGSPKAPYGFKKDGSPAKRRGRAKGAASVGGGSSKGLEALRKPLEQRLTEYLGAPLIFVSPIAAAVWEQRVESTANSILILAANSARWRKWVVRFVQGSAAGDLGITFAGVATGMLVDAGRVAPDGKVAMFYGIPDIYTKLYGAYVGGQNGSVEEHGLFAQV